MKSRKEIDPELHTLRSIVRSAEGRARTDLEAARFALFAAFEQGDADGAKRWARAMRVGLLALSRDELGDELRAMALEALGVIEASI